jgi:hypothetical protein
LALKNEFATSANHKEFRDRWKDADPGIPRRPGCQKEAGGAEGLDNGLKRPNLISDAVMPEKGSKIVY